jgi:hypothetical protein
LKRQWGRIFFLRRSAADSRHVTMLPEWKAFLLRIPQ